MKYLLAVTALTVFLGLTACGGAEASPVPPANEPTSIPITGGDPAAGQALFTDTCAVCHGPAGKGIEGLGKDMTTSQFIAQQTDTGLADFIKTGRPTGDPLNTTGVAMPPYGGNPKLTDTDLLNLIAYVRALQQ